MWVIVIDSFLRAGGAEARGGGRGARVGRGTVWQILLPIKVPEVQLHIQNS